MDLQHENPYAGPVATTPGQAHRGWLFVWFSFEGRISRSQYWLIGVFGRALAVMAVLVPVALVAVGLTAAIGEIAETIAVLMLLPLYFGFLWSEFALIVKRLHDRDEPGAKALLMLVPFANVYVWFVISFLAGTPGPNKYGPDPRS